jgi:hypothetical protein
MSHYETGVRNSVTALKSRSDEVIALINVKEYRLAVDEAAKAIEEAEEMFRFVVDCQQMSQFGSPAREEQ